jgi:hypothetical protein
MEILHSDLQMYLVEWNDHIILKHPLIFYPYSPEHNQQINHIFETKKQYIQKALDIKDFDHYIFLHERAYRLQAFVNIFDLLPDKQYWELLSTIWVDSENINENAVLWKLLLTRNKKYKQFFMNKEERAYFKKLPDTITIYRGYETGRKSRHPKKGFSYTLDEKTAMWFTRRYRNDKIFKRIIKKSEAFAVILRRSEQEIIVI